MKTTNKTLTSNLKNLKTLDIKTISSVYESANITGIIRRNSSDSDTAVLFSIQDHYYRYNEEQDGLHKKERNAAFNLSGLDVDYQSGNNRGHRESRKDVTIFNLTFNHDAAGKMLEDKYYGIDSFDLESVVEENMYTAENPKRYSRWGGNNDICHEVVEKVKFLATDNGDGTKNFVVGYNSSWLSPSDDDRFRSNVKGTEKYGPVLNVEKIELSRTESIKFLTNEKVLSVIKKAVKKRQDAIDAANVETRRRIWEDAKVHHILELMEDNLNANRVGFLKEGNESIVEKLNYDKNNNWNDLTCVNPLGRFFYDRRDADVARFFMDMELSELKEMWINEGHGNKHNTTLSFGFDYDGFCKANYDSREGFFNLSITDESKLNPSWDSKAALKKAAKVGFMYNYRGTSTYKSNSWSDRYQSRECVNFSTLKKHIEQSFKSATYVIKNSQRDMERDLIKNQGVDKLEAVMSSAGLPIYKHSYKDERLVFAQLSDDNDIIVHTKTEEDMRYGRDEASHLSVCDYKEPKSEWIFSVRQNDFCDDSVTIAACGQSVTCKHKNIKSTILKFLVQIEKLNSAIIEFNG